MLGFSAGGHLAAQLATRPDRPVYAPVDDADRLPARPDFLALGYPVISMGEAITHAISRRELLGPAPTAEAAAAHSNETQVTRDTPPSFLFHATDDADVPVANTLAFYQALHRAGVPAEMHVFARGGHGFSLRFAVGLPAAQWPDLMLTWMRSIRAVP